MPAQKHSGTKKQLGNFSNQATVLKAVCAWFKISLRVLKNQRDQGSWPFKAALFLLCHDTELQYIAIAQSLGIRWSPGVIQKQRQAVVEELRQCPHQVAELEDLRMDIYGRAKTPRQITASYDLTSVKKTRQSKPLRKKAPIKVSAIKTIAKRDWLGSGEVSADVSRRRVKIIETLQLNGGEMRAADLRRAIGQLGYSAFAKDMRVLRKDRKVVPVNTSRWRRYRLVGVHSCATSVNAVQ